MPSLQSKVSKDTFLRCSSGPPTPVTRCILYGTLGHSVTAQWTLGPLTLGRSPRKIARMTLTVKLDWNWSSFQLANSAPPLSVTDSAIAPSARMQLSPDTSRPVVTPTDESMGDSRTADKPENSPRPQLTKTTFRGRASDRTD